MAQQIRQMVEPLAIFLKQRELKGVLKFLFSHGILLLQLVLVNYNINMCYVVLKNERGMPIQIIVITFTMGGASFTLAWFSTAAILSTPPLVLLTFAVHSISQQIISNREYLEFKNMVDKLLNNDELKERLRAVIMEVKKPVSSSSRIEIQSPDLNKNLPLKYNFSEKPTEQLDEVIKEKIKTELGLVENPTEKQMVEIIEKRKSKGRTVYFQEVIKKILDSESNLNIIDAEIME